MAAAKSAVVIGGGFVGLSCALHLQRIGRRVVLVDRGSVGGAQSASYGNAGTMACYDTTARHSMIPRYDKPSCHGMTPCHEIISSHQS